LFNFERINNFKKTRMKINLLFTIAFLAYSFANAQTDRDALKGKHTANKTEALQYSVLDKNAVETRGGSGFCDSLMVQPTPNNGYDGVMFDMHVINAITLETFSMSLDAGNPLVGIFYRTGTYVGNEQSSAGWILLDSAQVAVPADGITKFPVDVNLTLSANSDYAFYVTVMDLASDCNYRDGVSAVGAIAASDINIQIKEGAGGAYPFDVTNSPRVLVGEAFYCLVPTGEEENELEKELLILPNPVINQLNISGSASIDQLEITDLSGRLMQSNNLERTIDCSGFAKGIYFIKITSGQKQVTRKFIKE
jgi:hypothetical protein